MAEIKEDKVLRSYDARVCPKAAENKKFNTLSDISRLLN